MTRAAAAAAAASEQNSPPNRFSTSSHHIFDRRKQGDNILLSAYGAAFQEAGRESCYYLQPYVGLSDILVSGNSVHVTW